MKEMLIDPRKKDLDMKDEGFTPNVQNKPITSFASVGSKILYWGLLGLITIWLFPMIYYFVTQRKYNRWQMRINEASSNIEVLLKQRKDTLIKLFDATKSAINYEKSVLTDITALRASKNVVPTDGAKIDSLWGRINATYENYPNLKAVDAIQQTMDRADYLEREISAARRLYNAEVTKFNETLFMFPSCVVGALMNLNTLPVIAASDEDKKDVSLNFSN